MTNEAMNKALEDVYTSLAEDNKDIDLHIAKLKSVLAEKGEKDIVVDANRLPQNNRQGRKMMQSYFRKRGVNVTFAA